LKTASVILAAADWKIAYFKNTWQSLLNQSDKGFEVSLVIVNRDESIQRYLNQHPANFLLKKYVCKCDDGTTHGRAYHNNISLAMASDVDICIGTQDDMILPENWIESHKAFHAEHHNSFVYNRIENALTNGDEDAFWERITNPRNIPIVMRWQYASGHSFSLPMHIAKEIKLDTAFGDWYGFEDIDFSYRAFKSGCGFYINTDVVVRHQDHGSDALSRRKKGQGVFMEWLKQRSYNRNIFMQKHGFCPEYGVWADGSFENERI